MNKYKLSITIVSVLIMLIYITCKKEKKRICELYSKPVGYAIGTIKKYVSSPGKVTYQYTFTANSSSYEGKERVYGIGQLDEKAIGKQYVVVYLKADPSENDLNTDFLIKSATDFQDFESKFADAPPPPNFPDKCK